MADLSMKGVYPIISMPFDDADRVSVEDLEREVEFLVAAGAHGLGVANNSEVTYLKEDERDVVLKTAVRQAAGRIKVIMSVSAGSTDHAVARARRAEELGADGVLAKPSGEPAEHYRRIASAVKVPVFIQDTAGAPVDVEVTAMLARETETVRYGKLERPPTLPLISRASQLAGDRLVIFGGAGGFFFVEEMRRGSQGIMAAVAISDVMRRVWDNFQAGREDEAEDEFNRYLPALKTQMQSGVKRYLAKEILRLRGVFTSVNVREPAQPADELAYREVRRTVERLGLGALVS